MGFNKLKINYSRLTRFFFGGTVGVRRTTTVVIPSKEVEVNISVIVIIATVGSVKRTTEKLIFAVPHHRLRNSRGPTLPPLDHLIVQRRHSAPISPSSSRYKSALHPPSQPCHCTHRHQQSDREDKGEDLLLEFSPHTLCHGGVI